MKARVDPAALQLFCEQALKAMRLPAKAAKVASEVLVRTELRGITSHGVWRLPMYVEQLRAGGARPDAEPFLVAEKPATATVDADAAVGLVAAEFATRVAMDKAQSCGVASVVVRNSNHFGAAGHYALLCAEAGLIGLIFSNSPVIMKVTGSRGAVIGNGPTAYGSPMHGKAPIVFDAAMSVVAGGRVRIAANRHEEVPDGWIVDSEGRNTRRPQAFTDEGGALVPLGDHKGYGLTLLGELLSGALSGAAMASGIVNWTKNAATPSNTGHAMLVVDPAAFDDPQTFSHRVSDLIDEIQSVPRATGTNRINYPGELEHEREVQSRMHGVELDDVVWQALSRTASTLGLEASLKDCVM